jgi:hypothetical protein
MAAGLDAATGIVRVAVLIVPGNACQVSVEVKPTSVVGFSIGSSGGRCAD